MKKYLSRLNIDEINLISLVLFFGGMVLAYEGAPNNWLLLGFGVLFGLSGMYGLVWVINHKKEDQDETISRYGR